MDIDELVRLIHAVPGGCTVEVTSINIPDNQRGGLSAVVTYEKGQRMVHDVEELRDVLGRLGKR